MFEIMMNNLLSPVVLFFTLGVVAALFKSDLKFPAGLNEALSIYLLIAIGLKGGLSLSQYSIAELFRPIITVILLGVAIPIVMLFVLRALKMDRKNAISLAACYGSVSIVTYGAALSFLDKNAIPYEGFMNAMVVVFEIPAILVSIILYNMMENTRKNSEHSAQSFGIVPSNSQLLNKEILTESLFGKSVLLLLGSLFIGAAVGERGLPTIQPLFIDLYSSVLILFLLNMGISAGKYLVPVIKQHGVKLLFVGLFMPIVFGTAGALAGTFIGLGLGSSALMGVLAGSASYIAAPAAIRSSIPDANPSIYLGAALGITFPFNLIIGIPIYFQVASFMN